MSSDSSPQSAKTVSLTQAVALKLSQDRENLEDEFAGRGRCVFEHAPLHRLIRIKRPN